MALRVFTRWRNRRAASTKRLAPVRPRQPLELLADVAGRAVAQFVHVAVVQRFAAPDGVPLHHREGVGRPPDGLGEVGV